MYILSQIIGKTIIAVKKDVGMEPAYYILFDDRETIMMLSEQDYYTYHDCDSSAMRISIWSDASFWHKLMYRPTGYIDVKGETDG